MIRFNDNAQQDAAFKQMLMHSSLSRNIRVEINGQAVPNSNIVVNSLEIVSSIMDERTFALGGCIASQLKLQFLNFDGFITQSGGLNGKMIRVWIRQTCAGNMLLPANTLYPSDSLYPGYLTFSTEKQIFTGYIKNITRRQNRAVVEVTAYDEFYRMSRAKCKLAIEGIFENSPSSIATLYDFAAAVLELYDGKYGTDFVSNLNSDKGFQYLIAPLQNISLSEQLFKKLADENLSVLDVLKAHCELNSRFACIAPDGSLRFVYLYKTYVITGGSGISTSQKDVDEAIQNYSCLSCEDYVTSSIWYIGFAYNGGEARYVYGSSSDERYWYLSDNIITMWSDNSTSVGNLTTAFHTGNYGNYIFNNLYSYRPFSMETFGEWWLEPGDKISASLQTYNPETAQFATMPVESFVFARKISGVSPMRVTVSANGTEYIGKDEMRYENE